MILENKKQETLVTQKCTMLRDRNIKIDRKEILNTYSF